MKIGLTNTGHLFVFLVFSRRFLYEVGVTLKSPKLNVGSTERYVKSRWLVQNLDKSANCLSVTSTIKGSPDSSCIRTKFLPSVFAYQLKVVISSICFLLGSEHNVLERSLFISYACALPLGMSASEDDLRGPPKSFLVFATALLVGKFFKFSPRARLTDDLVRVNVFPDLEFPCGRALMGCSLPLN